MTNPRDDGEAVALLERLRNPAWEHDKFSSHLARENIDDMASAALAIEGLSRQLAEAQQRSDYQYLKTTMQHEIETLKLKLAEAQGVIERQRRALQEIADFPYVGTAASQNVWGIARAALSQSAAYRTTGEPSE